jgi:hypothetical protein
MRIHLFEFEDLPWFPDAIRQGGTDYLRHFLGAVGFYKPVIPLINETLAASGQQTVLDLCSGGGGPVEQICRDLRSGNGEQVIVTLSDKFPNVNAYRYLAGRADGRITFKDFSVDATAVPAAVPGLRTMFSAVHHFSPETIGSILRDAEQKGVPIALFDGGDKNLLTILGILLFHPVAFLVCTPFFRPFRWSRLLFTYLLPLIPLTTVWDGCVSILRLYSPEELLKIAKASDSTYTWKAGKVKNKLGMNVTYLIGSPA